MDYWNNISRMQARQTAKGIKEYGQRLEDNEALTIPERITMAEEECIDLLMYMEHLKAGINQKVAEAYEKGYEEGFKKGSLSVTETIIKKILD